MEGDYGDIDADDSMCHGYCIIKFSSSPYTLQSDLSIYGQVISSGEMVCKRNFFNKDRFSLLCLQKQFKNTIVYLSKIITGNVNVIRYDSKNFVPPCLRYIKKIVTVNFHPYMS